jgi:hypothetical protein
VTSILPLPAEKVSTVKFAGAPTTGPVGSIPGPYARTLLNIKTELRAFSDKQQSTEEKIICGYIKKLHMMLHNKQNDNQYTLNKDRHRYYNKHNTC